ncbi:MAG: lanthionine synthetase LanC family protein [Bacteroidota bacterium]
MHNEYLKTAVRLGNQICREALRHEGRANWIATTSEPGHKYPKPYYKALQGDWYSGTSGIAFFLANLYIVSQEEIHKEIAIESIQQALSVKDKVEFGQLGFHSGRTGIAFSAIKVGELLQQPAFIEEGLTILKQLNRLPKEKYTLDIIDGCAGAIPAILNVIKKYPSQELETLLKKMGTFLMESVQPEKSGCSWNTMPQGTSGNLTGYAHGASGIALALLELGTYWQDKTYLKMASLGFAYEDSLFNQQQQNWPDLRKIDGIESSEKEVCGCAWCHGAPGIGLARLRAYQLTQKNIYWQQAATAIKTTEQKLNLTHLGNFSLCHGVLGNAELLLYANEIRPKSTYIEKAVSVGKLLTKNYEQKHIPIPNGTQTNYFSPDMMLGLSGMGYYFLRLLDAKQFPSVLLISPN